MGRPIRAADKDLLSLLPSNKGMVDLSNIWNLDGVIVVFSVKSKRDYCSKYLTAHSFLLIMAVSNLQYLVLPRRISLLVLAVFQTFSSIATSLSCIDCGLAPNQISELFSHLRLPVAPSTIKNQFTLPTMDHLNRLLITLRLLVPMPRRYKHDVQSQPPISPARPPLDRPPSPT